MTKSKNLRILNKEFMTLQKDSTPKKHMNMPNKRRTCSTGHTTNLAIDKKLKTMTPSDKNRYL